jgi:arsenate reductase
MANKTKVLFICQHNSGRSQIAEAYLKKLYGDHFEIESAGLEPAEGVNPLVIRVMAEVGFDLSEKKPQNVFGCLNRGNSTITSLRFAMTPNRSAQSFPGLLNAGIGHFQIPRQLKEKKMKSS